MSGPDHHQLKLLPASSLLVTTSYFQKGHCFNFRSSGNKLVTGQLDFTQSRCMIVESAGLEGLLPPALCHD